MSINNHNNHNQQNKKKRPSNSDTRPQQGNHNTRHQQGNHNTSPTSKESYRNNSGSSNRKHNVMNISADNVYGNCDLKCEYSFDYPSTTLVGKNNSIMLSYNCDNSTTSPVTFNSKKYNVKNIIIVTPSIHLFDGEKTDAEILVIHNPVLGGNPLIVGIPIIQSTNTNTATSNITDMITNMASNAPAHGETAEINISGFNLNNIIPKKPFYTYEGLDIHRSPATFIVYGNLDAIPLTSSTLNTLSSIIDTFTHESVGKYLFYNKNGPNGNLNTDGIYISCQPTGASEDSVIVDDGSSSSDTTYNLGTIFQNKTVQTIIKFIVIVCIFLVLFKGLSMAYVNLTKGPLKLTDLPFKKNK